MASTLLATTVQKRPLSSNLNEPTSEFLDDISSAYSRQTIIHQILAWKAKVRKTPNQHKPQKIQKYQNCKLCYEQKRVAQKTNDSCDAYVANLVSQVCFPPVAQNPQAFIVFFFLFESKSFRIRHFIFEEVLHCSTYVQYIYQKFSVIFLCEAAPTFLLIFCLPQNFSEWLFSHINIPVQNNYHRKGHLRLYIRIPCT